MRSKLTIVFILALAGVLTAQSQPASVDASQQPREYVYREIDGQKLKGFYVFPLPRGFRWQTPPVLLFHGGAWNAWAAPTGLSKPPAALPPWVWWPSRSIIVSHKALSLRLKPWTTREPHFAGCADTGRSSTLIRSGLPAMGFRPAANWLP